MPTLGFKTTSEISNLVLYDILPKGASELPDVEVKSSKEVK